MLAVGADWGSSKGIIPSEAEVKKNSKKFDKKDDKDKDAAGKAGYESEDEEVDEAALKKGELEG
jgi:hypothetical protein